VTALKEYARLEAPGVWRESPATQRRDVFVSFGNASLVITDQAGRPLAHWSLAAVERANPGGHPAVFLPGTDATETLEIDEETMVAAIEKVRLALARRRPQPGRLRGGLLAGALVLVLGLLVLVMPDALVRHTAGAVPPGARAEIGRLLLSEIGRSAGPPCAAEPGAGVLARLSERLFGSGGARLVVLPEGPAATAHLPGGIILVNRRLVEDQPGPDVLAGFALAEAARAALADPLVRVLEDAGTLATFRLLTSGALPQGALARHARRLLVSLPEPVPAEVLIPRFAAAKLPAAPYAYALDPTGETVLDLIETDALRRDELAPVLSDDDWVRLQGICGE
jgi:hypothetical protein